MRSTRALCLNARRLPALPASAPTAAATIAEPAPATAATTRSTARRLGTSFVYVERTAVQFLAVELRNGRLGFAPVCHFHERESTRLPCVTIGNNVHPLHRSILREGCVQFLL